MPITEIAGWIGMILVLVAYYLVSFNKKVTGQSILYQCLNLLGVTGIGINVFAQKAWPVFTLECIWAMIALASLFKIWRDYE